jgi:hypothetical protein
MSILFLVSATIALAALVLSLYNFFHLHQELDRNAEMIRKLERMTEEEVSKNSDEEEEGEESSSREEVEKEAEELFKYLKDIHGFEDATTYTELIRKIRGMDVEDEERKNKLIGFYSKILSMEYSDSEIGQEEVEKLKEEGEDLARTLEQSQEEQE